MTSAFMSFMHRFTATACAAAASFCSESVVILGTAILAVSIILYALLLGLQKHNVRIGCKL